MLTKSNSFRVLKIFFDNPEKKFHLRELARFSKLSPPGVIKIIKELEGEGLVISEKGNIVTNICASKSDKFIQMKRFSNLYSLYESEFVNFLRHEYEEPEAIVLFGSYSRGEDASNSDIDIAVVTNKNISSDNKKFEKYLKRKINVSEVKLSHAEKDFLNTLSNGIVLYGYLRLFL